MSDRMRQWDNYFDSTQEAVDYTVYMNGSFAMLYDYPAVQYYKGSIKLQAV